MSIEWGSDLSRCTRFTRSLSRRVIPSDVDRTVKLMPDSNGANVQPAEALGMKLPAANSRSDSKSEEDALRIENTICDAAKSSDSADPPRGESGWAVIEPPAPCRRPLKEPQRRSSPFLPSASFLTRFISPLLPSIWTHHSGGVESPRDTAGAGPVGVEGDEGTFIVDGTTLQTTATRQIRVLLVEDSVPIQKVMQNYLAGVRGCVVTVAADGKHGLDHMKAEEFDLVLTDFVMVCKEDEYRYPRLEY